MASPIDSSPPLLDPNAPAENGLTVSQVNQAIAHSLQRSFPEALWVQAEIQGFDRDAAKAGQRRWGQVYFELIEKEPGSDTVRASLKAVLWGDAHNALRKKLAEASGDLKLQDGLSVKFLCQVDFYWPRASLQLKVVDVDPHFTLGDMERARRELLQRLKNAGLLDQNRSVSFPVLPLAVGLITSEGSAAYHDFVHELASSGYAFQIVLVESHTQGPETESDVVRALDLLARRPDVDLIVLVRGGGSRSDLIWFDKEKIARAIALCPKPVITGIGHEIDQSVADLVAHASRKTPTAVAQFLVERAALMERGVQEMTGRLLRAVHDRLAILSRELTEALRAWRALAGAFATQANADLREKQMLILAAARRHLGVAGERLRSTFPRLKRSAEEIVRRSAERLAAFERECALRDPRRLLERGYGVMRVGGKLIKSVRDVRSGDFIEARLSDGTFSANVLGVTPVSVSPKGKTHEKI